MAEKQQPMKNGFHQQLSRRERQIMDVLFKLGRATASDIQKAMADAPSYSAVRTHLRTLEEKGHARHEAEDLRYVYLPVVKPAEARKSAMAHMVDTFFRGSAAEAAAALIDSKSARISAEELDRLSELIEKARKEGR
jgi:BlaI family transcriptional regulator, penicillinase repressor